MPARPGAWTTTLWLLAFLAALRRPRGASALGPDARPRRVRLPRARGRRARVRGRAGGDPLARPGRVPRDRRVLGGAPAHEGRLAAPALARRGGRDHGGRRRADGPRDRTAAQRVRRRQHLDPQLDLAAPADLVPGDLGRSARARAARGDGARPHVDAERPLRDRAHAPRARRPRARRDRPPGAGARASPRPGTSGARRRASASRSHTRGWASSPLRPRSPVSRARSESSCSRSRTRRRTGLPSRSSSSWRSSSAVRDCRSARSSACS